MKMKKLFLAGLGVAALTGVFGCALYNTQDQTAALKAPPAPFAAKRESALATGEMAKPEFTPDGIVCGSKILRWSPIAPMALTIDEKVVMSFSCRATWPPFSNFKIKTDQATKTMTSEAELPPDKKLIQTAKLLDDGRVEIVLSFKGVNDPKLQVVDLLIPKQVAQGQTVSSGEQSFTFPGADKWGDTEKLWDHMGCFHKRNGFVFKPQSPAEGFAIEFPKATITGVYRDRIEAVLKPGCDGESLILLVDFRETPKKSMADDCVLAGINFTKCDDLDVPVYNKDGNLLMNPSFESGTRYWRSNALGNFSLDESMLCDTEAFFGKRSCRLGSVSSVSIPVEPSQPHTFSFYAYSLDGSPRNVAVAFLTYGKKQQPEAQHQSVKQGVAALRDHIHAAYKPGENRDVWRKYYDRRPST